MQIPSEETPKPLFQLIKAASPQNADIAIVSIDSDGNPGSLNQFVLKQYGYSDAIIRSLNLAKGFDLFQMNGRPILFVVTVSSENTEHNLRKNLLQAIITNDEALSNKRIWIPLMGTGSGGLSLVKSYSIIVDVLLSVKQRLQTNNSTFIISIPDNNEGDELFDHIQYGGENESKGIATQEVDPKTKAFANDIIDTYRNEYYLVGSIWDGADQVPRFFKEGIWEHGYENGAYANIMEKVAPGDVLILKSVFATRDGRSMMRVKAFAVVLRNVKNQRTLEVRWLEIPKSPDLEMGYYRDTISRPSREDLLQILSNVSNNDVSNLRQALSSRLQSSASGNDQIPPKPPTDVNSASASDTPDDEPKKKTITTNLAGLLSDGESGADYLDISKDVAAFARVMAAKSFQPPLAIALLGKWGSGKSFFMRKLKEHIQYLSQTNPKKAFCEGIAHVHFNAWSYMDSNLWASIVTRIFEGLNMYIKDDSLASKNLQEVEKKLTENLVIAKDEVAALAKQNLNIQAQLEMLHNKRNKAESELQKRIKTIQEGGLKKIIEGVNSEFKVREQLKAALDNNKSFVETEAEFEKIVPAAYWDDPKKLYDEVNSTTAFIKTSFFGKNAKSNLLWVGFILLLIIVIPIIVEVTCKAVGMFDFRLGATFSAELALLATMSAKVGDAYRKYKPFLASFWRIKQDYDKEMANAISSYSQQEKALTLEIENKKDAIATINEQISQTQLIKSSITFKLQNALSTEALYTFIEKRSTSDDYKKHLGIVSVIRQDFEILSGLLTGHQSESKANEQSEAFREMFEHPLDRIVLYIDDLDRCPEERVVEVLEAVNLLMAFPLFVVVVGVDPRWVRNALLKRHHLQFAGNGDKTLELIEPSSYLEKIFQVPFQLKKASDTSIKNMIEKLAMTKPALEVSEVVTAGVELKASHEYDGTGVILENPVMPDPLQTADPQVFEEQILALDITTDEIVIIQSMADIIGHNPRQIKRFLNIYRIVKTHEDFNYDSSTPENELKVVMYLLAVSIGNYHGIAKSLAFFLESESDKTRPLSDYFSEANNTVHMLVDQEAAFLKGNLRICMVSKFRDLYGYKIELYLKHYSFIKRFTFENF